MSYVRDLSYSQQNGTGAPICQKYSMGGYCTVYDAWVNLSNSPYLLEDIGKMAPTGFGGSRANGDSLFQSRPLHIRRDRDLVDAAPQRGVTQRDGYVFLF